MTTITDLESRNAAPRQDSQDPSIFGQTPWQTVGPYFHYGLPWKGGADLVGRSEMGARPDLMPPEHFLLSGSNDSGQPEGEVIALAGCVYDADGKPIDDAMIEIWQANANGRYASPDDDRADIALDRHFVGFGRASTDRDGVYRFRTIRPGRVPGPVRLTLTYEERAGRRDLDHLIRPVVDLCVRHALIEAVLEDPGHLAHVVDTARFLLHDRGEHDGAVALVRRNARRVQ